MESCKGKFALEGTQAQSGSMQIAEAGVIIYITGGDKTNNHQPKSMSPWSD